MELKQKSEAFPKKKFKDLIHCYLYHFILGLFMDKQNLIYFQEDKK